MFLESGITADGELIHVDEARRAQRGAAIAAGMARAAAEGKHVGRPADDYAAILAKYPAIVEVLETGESLRSAAARTGAAINTVRKVKTAIEMIGDRNNQCVKREALG